MNSKNQGWQALDLSAGSLPPEVESALGDGDFRTACVVILVDSEIDRDWGARASVAVAKSWAASGHRVLLADARLDSPVLHETVGVENGEGVSDMVLYGASAPRVAGQVEEGLVFAPAGTPVVEPADVLSHIKWDMVIRGCREAKATLVFHVSTGTPGVEALAQRAEGVVLLAPASRDVEAILGSQSGLLIAVMGPENGEAPLVAVEDGPDAVDEPVAVVEEPAVAAVDEPIAVVQEPVPVVEEPVPVVEEPVTVVEEPVAVEEESVTVEDLAAMGEQAPVEDSSEPIAIEEGLASVEDIAVEPVPPVEDSVAAEDASTVEPSPGLPEDEAVADAFALTDLEGAQYQAEGESPPVQSDDAETGVAIESGDDATAADVLIGTGVDSEAEGGVEADAGAGVESGTEDLAILADLPSPEDESPTSIDVQESAPDDLMGLSDLASFEGGGPGLTDDVGAGLPDLDFVDATTDAGMDSGTFDSGAGDTVEAGVDPAVAPEGSTLADSLAELVIEDAPPEAESEAETEEPATKRRRKYRGLARLERRRKRAVFVRQFLTALLTVGVVGGGGVGAAYYGLINIPGITPPERVRSNVPAPVALPGDIPVSATMSHVLMIDTWRTTETPMSTAAALRTRLPDHLFFITPLELDGVLQYALYVGPAYSAVEADALKEPVAVVMDRLDPNDWSVRDAPYAFFFGEYDTPVNAQGRIDALGAASIPAYALQVTYADSTTGVRVYGGAFTDEFEAAEMGRMVSAADVGGMVLTSRRGTIPE